MTPRRILLVGTGLIGGSIGLGLREAWTDAHITAIDRDQATAHAAVALGAAHSVGDFPDARDADMAIISVPVGAVEGVLRSLAQHLGPSTLVTDTGSTKAGFLHAAEQFLPAGQPVVGGHPMAGSESHGIASARLGLFTDAWWILTPSGSTATETYRRALALPAALGARTLALEPTAHDGLMATVSHLPQLLASTLMRLAAAEGQDRAALLALAAGGFRDMTRIASSQPEMWVDICRENSSAITDRLRAFAGEIERVATLIDGGVSGDLTRFFEEARDARAGIPLKAAPAALVEITIDIPDRPGVLAEVATTMGALGVNIEDLSIEHAGEGGHGALSVWVREDVGMEPLLAALKGRGLVIASCPYISEAEDGSVHEGTQR